MPSFLILRNYILLIGKPFCHFARVDISLKGKMLQSYLALKIRYVMFD